MEQMFLVQSEETLEGGAFFVLSHDKRVAELLWKNAGDNTIEVYRTFTDPSLRGKGVANDLVERVASFAKAQGYKIIATCWYAEKVLSSAEQYRGLLVSPAT